MLVVVDERRLRRHRRGWNDGEERDRGDSHGRLW
jgi:hypothetical protein